MTLSKLRVALVGCGQIADAHLQEIRKISCAKPVAVCDRHPDLARQLAVRFEVPESYEDFERMLERSRPDVLHVTAPPQLHASMACQALERGIHVYIEKPFTVTVAETDSVLRAARDHKRLVCAGHDQLFDPLWEECRRLVRQGELGRLVHVDSIHQYDLNGPFGKAVRADANHWVHRLPGKLFQNVIPHAVYKVADLIPDEEPQLWATAFAGQAGGEKLPSELRVLLRGQQTTANIMFSSAARPVQRMTRLYGTKQLLEVDADAWVLRHFRAGRLPGAFAKLEFPARELSQAARNLLRNLWRFFRCRIHFFAGMRRLFELFYEAIRNGGEPPIAYGDIRRVSVLMDRIFQASLIEPAEPAFSEGSVGSPVPAGNGQPLSRS